MISENALQHLVSFWSLYQELALAIAMIGLGFLFGVIVFYRLRKRYQTVSYEHEALSLQFSATISFAAAIFSDK